MVGCDTVVRCVWLAEDEVRIDVSLLVAIGEGGGDKCGMTDPFVFLDALYFPAAGGVRWFIGRVFRCFWVRFSLM